MLFPVLGPQYYTEKDKPILARMETAYSEAITINQSFWGESDTDLRFYLGDQTLYNQVFGNLPANRRTQFNFNRIRRVVDMISGYQRRNRKSMIIQPIENGDAQTADQFTKAVFWLNEQEGILNTISDAFQGALITGLNLLEVWVDYRSDPISGNIRVDKKNYNDILIDPFFKKSDLSDCNFIWTRSYLTKREVVSLLPDLSDEVLALQGIDVGMSKDSKFQFQAESYNYAMRNLLTYDQYWYRDYRTQKLLVDTESGETMEWKHDDKDKLKQFLSLYPTVTVVEQDIPTVRLAIICQGKVMYDGPNPLGIDKYPYVPVFAYYHPESPYYPWRIVSVVRGLRDAQYLYNRRKIIELDILESTINSGWKFKENALVNPNDVWNLQGQGKGLAIKDEAAMTDVEQIQPPQVPPSMIELSKIMGEEISQISGVNEELIGSSTDEKAGILAMLRQGAGLTTLQSLFDNLDNSQKLLGKLIVEVMQANFTPGKMAKILEGQKPSQEFYDKNFGTYHCAVEEGINSTTQKQMQLAQLIQLREIGVPVPDDVLLEACTLQNKKELIESIQKSQQQQQQMQQQQMQAQLEEQAARTQLAQARAQADIGLGVERASRVEENQALAVERRAAAVADQDRALLDLVKAMREIEGMDIDHITRLIQAANVIKNQDATLNNQLKEVK